MTRRPGRPNDQHPSKFCTEYAQKKFLKPDFSERPTEIECVFGFESECDENVYGLLVYTFMRQCRNKYLRGTEKSGRKEMNA